MNKKNFDLVMFFLISLGFISTTTVEAGHQYYQVRTSRQHRRTFQPRKENPQNHGRIRVNTNRSTNRCIIQDSRQINYFYSTRIKNFQNAVREQNNKIRLLERKNKSLKRRITTIFNLNDIPALKITDFSQMWKNMKPYEQQNLTRCLLIACTEIRETLEPETNKKR